MYAIAKLPLGISDFKELVEGRYICVDKTLIIQDVVDDPAKVILIPRPRRFGKTINLSMLKYFFSNNDLDENKLLFAGLKIVAQKALCAQYQGRHPVIFLTLKGVKERCFEEACQSIALVISRLYENYRYLLSSDALSQDEKVRFQKVLATKASLAELKNSIRELTEYLFRYHKIKPFLLLDEYDEPIHAAYINGYYEDMAALMRVLLGEALKDNEFLHKAVITGILRVGQASIFSGLNNIKTYSILQNRYGEHFGFTEDEVNVLRQRVLSPHALEDITAWYNGYHFGNQVLYNPWSIVNCLSNADNLQIYWVNTSDNALIKSLVADANVGIKQKIERLIQGEVVPCAFDENIIFPELKTLSTPFWSLLLFAGYLKLIDKKIADDGLWHCHVAIPNKEVLTLYIKMVKEWFTGKQVETESYQDFVASFVAGDVERFSAYIMMYLNESGSYFDFNQKTPEQVYHALVLGLVVGLRDDYIIKSNRESGFGRYDVMIQPKDNARAGMVLEFKTATNIDQLQATAEAALTQIGQQSYVQELHQAGVKRVICLGLAFAGRDVRVLKNEVLQA